MFSTLTTRFGIPGVISVIAVVFAMFGGAYAATNSSSGKATASAKAKKGPRGPKGATGPAGPQGPAGAAGAKGDAGANGTNGSVGAAGANGTNGTSVTSAPEAPGPNCTNGGAKFTSASPSATYACNGANGAPGVQGPEGDPWTAGGTLPSGSTEKGIWAYTGSGNAVFGGFGEISFTIPLAVELDETHVSYLKVGENNANCTGSVNNPTAAKGYLCVYAGPGTTAAPNGNATFVMKPDLSAPGTGVSGALLNFEPTESAVVDDTKKVISATGSGSWAVTAP